VVQRAGTPIPEDTSTRCLIHAGVSTDQKASRSVMPLSHTSSDSRLPGRFSVDQKELRA
jgi:hypothetical protein